MKTLTHRLLFALLLLASPLFATASGGSRYGYYGPPPYGYYVLPAYPRAYAPRPFFVQPYAYGRDRRYGGYGGHHGWHDRHGYRSGYRGYGGHGGYGGWGGAPRSGFSFYYSD